MVLIIRSYAVTTASTHDFQIDLSRVGILVYRDKGYFAYCDTDSIFVKPDIVKDIQDFFRPLNPVFFTSRDVLFFTSRDV